MYEEDWAEYRRVRNRFWALWLLYVPVVAGLTWLSSLLLDSFLAFGMGLAICWMVVWVYYGFRLNGFRCPRCGEWFSAKWWYNRSFFARSCVHCGLKKFSTGG
jgi:hypothetical protein